MLNAKITKNFEDSGKVATIDNMLNAILCHAHKLHKAFCKI